MKIPKSSENEEYYETNTPLLDHNLENTDTALISGSLIRTRSTFTRKSFVGGEVTPTLGAMALCFIAYFNVSGGPWGTEEIISSLGPLPGFIGIFLMAIFWAFPLILVTSELSSTYPDDGGYSIWVAEAFGEFWGFQESYWSWVSGVIDNAVYPLLAFHTLRELFDLEDSFLVKFLITIIFSLPTAIFVENFGKSLFVMFAFIMTPFFIFAVYSFSYTPNMNNLNIITYETSDDIWNGIFTFLPILYWNFSGLDCVSTCAGEVKNPKHSYIIGLSFALLLIILTYLITLAAAVVSVDNGSWTDWVEGSLITVITDKMGNYFGFWVLLASLVGNMGMHLAEMFEDSWQLCGMAESGLAPTVFAYRSKTFNTPIVAILFSIFLICLLITLDFRQIIIVNNFFSVLSALLELCAFASIRLNETEAKDSTNIFRIPIETKAQLIMFLFIPLFVGSFVLFTSLFDSLFSFIVDFLAVIFGLLFYSYMKSIGSINYKRNN